MIDIEATDVIRGLLNIMIGFLVQTLLHYNVALIDKPEFRTNTLDLDRCSKKMITSLFNQIEQRHLQIEKKGELPISPDSIIYAALQLLGHCQ